MKNPQRVRRVLLACACTLLIAACVMTAPGNAARHRWWTGLGPVLPHDTFPSDCKLCHVGEKWHELKDDFEYDHEAETGVRLEGAHDRAGCLLCHNDRGPVANFYAQGCAGCHEDVHWGRLGAVCTSCHQQQTWQPVGQIEMHNRTRFPLVGIHAGTACRRCHPGAEVGSFSPVSVECVTCHTQDLQQATNPNHLALGYVDRCDRCHIPTDWHVAEVK